MEFWKRMCLFLTGCMGARFGLAYLAYKLPTKYLPYMGLPGLAISLGFALIYIKRWRKTGLEVGGAKIWWNIVRPIHAGLWFVFAIMSFAKDRHAWIALLTDAILGLVAFSMHHLRLMDNRRQ